MQKGISVIICCYNSSGRIAGVLDCLYKQNKIRDLNYEIIVVDNASTDNTAALTLKTWKGNPNVLKVITEKKPGLSYARMAGISASKYDIINFIDDDNYVNENWLYLINSIMRSNEEIGMLGGLGIPKSNAALPDWFEKYRDAYAVGPQGKKSGIVPDERAYLHGAGVSIRRTIWVELEQKGFKFYLTGRKGKSLSSGEDFEMSSAVRLLGYQLYYEEDLVFQHQIPETRLTEQYILDLYKAFGNASNIVHAYKSVSTNGSFKERLKYNVFITSVFYSLIKFIEYQIKYAGLKNKMDIRNDICVMFWYWRNNLIFKLRNPLKVMLAYRDINKFVENCER